MTAPRNASESVRQRLLNRSRKERRPFNELLQYFVMERFLYRLSQSAHAQRFVLKGALRRRSAIGSSRITCPPRSEKSRLW